MLLNLPCKHKSPKTCYKYKQDYLLSTFQTCYLIARVMTLNLERVLDASKMVTLTPWRFPSQQSSTFLINSLKLYKFLHNFSLLRTYFLQNIILISLVKCSQWLYWLSFSLLFNYFFQFVCKHRYFYI